jgi:uncharacterized protein YfaQ (DUF2300 family)
MATMGNASSTPRDARAHRCALTGSSPSAPGQAKRQKTSAAITLDTRDGGRAELRGTHVRVTTGTTPTVEHGENRHGPDIDALTHGEHDSRSPK